MFDSYNVLMEPEQQLTSLLKKYSIQKQIWQNNFSKGYLVTTFNPTTNAQTPLLMKVVRYKNPSLKQHHSVAVEKQVIVNQTLKLMKLKHQNIIQSIDWFDNQQTCCIHIIMEYLQINIGKQVSSKTQFSTLKKYLFQIGEAMKYLRQRDIVYVDLSPSNILLRNGSIKIYPQFISKNSFKQNKFVQCFPTNKPQYYCAPQIHQSNHYSVQAVMWTLGIVILQLTTSQTIQNIIPKIEHHDTLPYQIDTFPKQQLEMIPYVEMRSLVSRMLLKDPKERITIQQLLTQTYQLVQHTPFTKTIKHIIQDNEFEQQLIVKRMDNQVQFNSKKKVLVDQNIKQYNQAQKNQLKDDSLAQLEDKAQKLQNEKQQQQKKITQLNQQIFQLSQKLNQFNMSNKIKTKYINIWKTISLFIFAILIISLKLYYIKLKDQIKLNNIQIGKVIRYKNKQSNFSNVQPKYQKQIKYGINQYQQDIKQYQQNIKQQKDSLILTLQNSLKQCQVRIKQRDNSVQNLEIKIKQIQQKDSLILTLQNSLKKCQVRIKQKDNSIQNLEIKIQKIQQKNLQKQLLRLAMNKKWYQIIQWNKNNDLKTLKSLDLSNRNIDIIYSQFSCLVGLKELKLSKNKIKKIQNLEKLTSLETLWLDSNQVSKIQNLQQLKNLNWLTIGGNKIKKIENLEKLSKLKQLYLWKNQIKKIENLAQLKELTKLSFGDNNIIKIQNLEMLNKLTQLHLYNNQINKIDGLENLIQLRVIQLHKNKIIKIENLKTHTKLNKLSLGENKIMIIENLERLHQLTQLRLYNNQINKIDGLENLIQLRVIQLQNNYIIKIQNLEKLNKLTQLHLYTNQIKKIENLEKLFYLNTLYLENNKIQKIQNLKQLHALTFINLRNNPILDSEKYKLEYITKDKKIVVLVSKKWWQFLWFW